MNGCALLSGLRILDFTFQGAGPYATMLLALLGADVIKVESERHPDPTRGRENRPYLRSLLYDDVNLGKRSLTADMQSAEGRRIVRSVADRCDAVVDNFRPGVMRRWGLDYSSIATANPRVVSASLTAMGSEGPLALLPGYAGIFNAFSGLGALNGYPGGPPTELRTSVDMRAGAFFAFGIVHGLQAAIRTGTGCRIDMSASEAITALAGEFLAAHLLTGEDHVRIGNADPDVYHQGVYNSKNGAWIAVTLADGDGWARLVDAAALPARQGADPALRHWIAASTAKLVLSTLHGVGIAAAVVADAEALLADSQLEHRRFFVELPERANGTRRVVASAPWLIDGDRPDCVPGPDAGADGRDVLRELLGLCDSELDELTASGALR